MNATAIDIARERQLDWLLAEVLGEPPRAAARSTRAASTWLTAALVLLATGVAFAVAWLNEPGAVTPQPAQEPPEPAWHECHGPGELDAVPADVVNLRCFDFDDAALDGLSRLERLERLDLSGMDADERGVSTMVQITDAGVAKLATLTSLRWLSLAGCQNVKGATLGALRAIPQLEHLDVGQTSMVSESFVHFAQLPSLRSLVLSRNLAFHGRSLAEIARLPGLRRLELAGCSTVSAKDVAQLANLRELTYLDLTDCMGTFRGQKGMVVKLEDVTGQDLPPPPVEDGVGVTDEAVAALRELPLETLKLYGCVSLTDDVAGSLRAMPKLRHLDIGDLRRTTAAILTALPRGLRSLSLDGNHNYTASGLRALRRFPELTELGLNGLKHVDDDLLAEVLTGKPLTTLRIGGTPRLIDARGPSAAHRPKLTPRTAATLAQLRTLRTLDVSYADWLDAPVFDALGALSELQELECRSADVPKAATKGLRASRSLRRVSFLFCSRLDVDSVRALVGLPLAELDLYGTKLEMDAVRRLAPSFPGCRVRTPVSSVIRVPD